ncbi:MAG: hypothetical protein RQ966_01195 [Acetobacteraceae bacterium]|nr:hypothetical protein [Acetobacteraceae bacterium]
MSAAAFPAGRNRRDVVPPHGEEAPVSAREMAAIALRHRWKIAVAFLLPPVIAVALVILLPKTYRAQSDIMVKTGREYMAQGDLESANLTAPTSTKQEGINSEIALLTSRSVAEATIAAIGVEELYPDLVAHPPSSGSVLDAAVLQFSSDFSVAPVKLSNVIATSFDAASPARAQQVLNTIIRLYIDKHTQVFAGRRADGFRDSIEKALGEIRRLEERRSTLKLTGGVYDIDAQRRALIAQRTDAETRLQDAKTRQARLVARLAYLEKARGQVAQTTLLASTERSDAQSHAAQSLVDLRQQEAALSSHVGSANPDLQRLRSELDAVRRAAETARKERNATTAPSPLRQQIEQELVFAGADLATTGSEIQRLGTFVASCSAELARLERVDLELRDIVLQIDTMTQSLRSMQARYEQARADEQTDIARQASVVQIAGASGSERPVSPKKLLVGAAGVLGGLLLSGIVGFLAVLTSKTAVTGEAAERRVGLPVLAVVPFRKMVDEPVFGSP